MSNAENGRAVVPLGTSPVDRPRLTDADAPDYANVLACIRCGLCLAVCPTYSVERTETQSPRGRVALIRAAKEGRLPVSAGGLREHLAWPTALLHPVPDTLSDADAAMLEPL